MSLALADVESDMRLRPVIVGAVLCGLAVSSFAAQAVSGAKTRALPAFTPPLALAGGGGEPSIRVAVDGKSASYVSAPAGLGSNFWRVDQVKNPDGTYAMVGSKPQQPDLGTGGGDSEISVSQVVDPKTGCATIAYSGLHNIDLLDNFTTAVSTDCGKTFSTPNLYATQNTLTDRQWQVFDGAKTNHLLYHKVDTGQIVDSVSYDGGQTYVTLGTAAGATGVIDAAHSYTLKNVKIGNVVVDRRRATGATYPVSGEPVHTLYAVFNGVRDATDAALAQADHAPGSRYDHLNSVYVGRSDDGGLTWTDTQAFTTNGESRRELDLIFPVVDVDQSGNVYAAWTDGNRIEYVVSTDGAKTWSKPYLVNPREAGARSKNGTADIFPWIAAGANGNLDIVWYHGQGGNTTGYRQVGDKDTNWTVAFAQLSHAVAPKGTTPRPGVVSRNLAVTPVMHRGNVCNNGTTCLVDEELGNGGDRTLLDFFQVAIDKAGRANIAYADDATSPGSSTIKYTRQNTGRSLTTGKPLQGLPFVPAIVKQLGTSCPGPQVVDRVGDASGSVTTGTPTMNDDTLDVRDVRFATTRTGLRVTLRAKNLSSLPAPGVSVANLWRVTWSMGRRSFYLTATSNGPGLQTYSGGEVVAGSDTVKG
ncbi:MAG: glycoside hydrolase, partial [Actinomycetota bacterium]|nr:glycoside hydrolase [Actinomycetota bacterium]